MSLRRLARLAPALLLLVGTLGCGALFGRKAPSTAAGVPIEKRPSPVVPDTTLAVVVEPSTAPANPPPMNGAEKPAPQPQPTPPAPAPPVEAAMSPEERQASLTRIIADTTAAGAAVRKCLGRELLPDQESVFETTRSLLSQTRSAVQREELWRAESLARKARQLALSLDCR